MALASSSPSRLPPVVPSPNQRRFLVTTATLITEQAKAKAVDGQALNWLCSAQERLAEQERILAGRPLPGSRKPAPEPRQPRQSFIAGPVGEVEPVPAFGVEPVPG